MGTVDGYWVEACELDQKQPLHWVDAGNSQLYSVDYDGEVYLYKEYTTEFRSDADQHALGELIRWRHTLSAPDRTHLDDVAAWPRHRVRDNGLLQGVLLPFAPRQFFERWDDGSRPRMLAQLIRLNAAGHVRPEAPADVKHAALGHAADKLLWFHSQGVVVNDVRELNVLCTAEGREVFYVDCDVMVGPWRSVGPPAAPAYMKNAIQGLDRPTRETDIARLAWMSAAILLDDLALPEVRADRLRKVTDPDAAQLLATASRPHEVDREEWRRLIRRWTAPRRVGYARVSRPEPGPAAEVAAATGRVPLPPTRPLPVFRAEAVNRSFRVPDRFRRPDPVYEPPPTSAATAPAMAGSAEPRWLRSGLSRRDRALLVGALLAVLVLCGLVTLALSLRGTAL